MKRCEALYGSRTDFHHAVTHFRRCGLSAHLHHVSIGAGPENAAIMDIGEAPGREEDLDARPFVG